ncbi:HAD hydrolase family protein [Priestia megaterium]
MVGKVNKGRGIEEMVNDFNLAEEEIVGIGERKNDLAMFEFGR